MTASIVVPYQEFRQMVSTFCKESSGMNLSELDNSHKCVTLAYIGLEDKLLTEREKFEAPILVKIATKKFFEREYDLLNS